MNTRNEIIEMARQAGFSEWAVQTPNDLIAFAKLVAAKERVACFDAAYDAHATTLVLEAIRARSISRGEA